MKKIRIKKGDTVKILTGKDNGKSGVVENVFSHEGKIVVKGINMYKKHVKPSKKYPSGGIIDLNKPIDVSNVMLICPNCGKLSKIEFNIDADSKIRTCKKCKKSVELGAE
jgi:large subunit ribosomal protein L24